MTRVDDILEELRKGTNLKEISSKYKSRSSITKALEIYEPEIVEQIQGERDLLSTLNNKVNTAQKQLSSLDGQNQQLSTTIENARKNFEKWTNETTEEKRKLQQELDGLKTITEKKHQELEGIKSRLSDLDKKGITKDYPNITCKIQWLFKKYFIFPPYFLRHNRFSKLADKGVSLDQIRQLKGAKRMESITPYFHLSTALARVTAKKID